MPVPFSELTTPGGYKCGEVASALQKEIRRGNEREALFWASELDLAGYGNYVFKRLRVIASEDVGIADSNVAVQVWALYRLWQEARRKKGEPEGHFRVHLVHAVVLLCRAPKSRLADSALIAFYTGERPKPEIPDYALDLHTARGRRMGRGVDHFYAEGAKVVNETIDDPYLDEAKVTLSRAKRTSRTRPGIASDADAGQLELG
jgi:replication-associated recombination protein RarA